MFAVGETVELYILPFIEVRKMEGEVVCGRK